MELVHRIPDDPALLDCLRDTLKTEMVERETAWRYVLDEAWMYALLELRSYVEKGEAYCRLRAGEDPLRIDWKIDIDAPAEAVFRALVEPEEIRRWNTFVGDEVRIERKKGGRYSFGWKSESTHTDGPDEIVEYEEGHRISYSWWGSPKTLVSWTVDPLPGEGRTRLSMVHSGFVGNPDVVLDYKLGWTHFLFALADWVEHQAPDRFPGRQGRGGGRLITRTPPPCA